MHPQIEPTKLTIIDPQKHKMDVTWKSQLSDS